MKNLGTGMDRAKNMAALLLLLGMGVFLLLSWQSLPERIPGHYNAAGVVDRWGGKREILFTPVMALVLYLFISWLERFPQAWNTGVKVTEENRERVYGALKSMIVTMKLLLVGVFSYLTVYQATGMALPGGFLPVFLLLLFGSTGYYLVKLNRVK